MYVYNKKHIGLERIFNKEFFKYLTHGTKTINEIKQASYEKKVHQGSKYSQNHDGW